MGRSTNKRSAKNKKTRSVADRFLPNTTTTTTKSSYDKATSSVKPETSNRNNIPKVSVAPIASANHKKLTKLTSISDITKLSLDEALRQIYKNLDHVQDMIISESEFNLDRGTKTSNYFASKLLSISDTQDGMEERLQDIDRKVTGLYGKLNSTNRSSSQGAISQSKAGLVDALFTAVDTYLLTKGSSTGSTKMAKMAKGIAPMLSTADKVIPKVNAVVSTGIGALEYFTSNNDVSRMNAIGSSAGSVIGGTAGFALTSWVPIPGARVAGTMLGSWVGNWAGTAISEAMADVEDYIPDNVKKDARNTLLYLDGASEFIRQNGVNPFTKEPIDRDEAKELLEEIAKYRSEIEKSMTKSVKAKMKSEFTTPGGRQTLHLTAPKQSSINASLPSKVQYGELKKLSTEDADSFWIGDARYTFKELVDKGYIKGSEILNKPGSTYEKFKYIRNMDNWNILGGLPEFIKMEKTKSLSPAPKPGEAPHIDEKLNKIMEEMGIVTNVGEAMSNMYIGVPSVANTTTTSVLGSSPTHVSKDMLGWLSAQYESNGNPAVVAPDTGGWAYGKYQIHSRNIKEFLDMYPEVYAKFADVAINSKEFRSRWRQVHKDPEFAKLSVEAQHDYIKKTHYNPVIEDLEKLGIDPNNLSNTIKNVIWSMAVQHKHATDDIFLRASKNSNTAIKDLLKDEATLIKELYRARIQMFTPNNPKLVNRFRSEYQSAIEALGVEKNGGVGELKTVLEGGVNVPTPSTEVEKEVFNKPIKVYNNVPGAEHGKRENTNYVVWHRTAGTGEFNPNDPRVTRQGFAGHIWIEKDGTIKQIGSLDTKRHHSRKSRGGKDYGHDWNRDSIGVEVVGAYHPKGKGGDYGDFDSLTEEQVAAIRKTVRLLMQKYPNLTPENFRYHGDLHAGKKYNEGIQPYKVATAEAEKVMKERKSKDKTVTAQLGSNEETTKAMVAGFNEDQIKALTEYVEASNGMSETTDQSSKTYKRYSKAYDNIVKLFGGDENITTKAYDLYKAYQSMETIRKEEGATRTSKKDDKSDKEDIVPQLSEAITKKMEAQTEVIISAIKELNSTSIAQNNVTTIVNNNGSREIQHTGVEEIASGVGTKG